DGLLDAALQAGVEIATGTKIERIKRDAGGAARSVRTADGQVVYATNIVIAAGPTVAASLVERGEQTRLARWANEAIPVKAACLDVALHRLPTPKALYAFGIDRPLYLSVHSASARLAPAGGALIHVAKYLAPDDDILSIHVQLSARTRGLVGARELHLMKPTAYLINTARGPIVDEAALVQALQTRTSAGAGLDVFDQEPLPPGHPLT